VVTSVQAAERPGGVDHPPFSLMQGGLLHRGGRVVGIPPGTRGLVYLGFGLAVLTWLPLLVFAVAAGTLASGRTVTFLAATAVHARLLLGIPLFFVAEAAFDLRVGQVLRALVDSQLVPERHEPVLDKAVARASRWRDAGVIEIAAVVITVILAVQGVRSELPATVSTWRYDLGGQPNLAGWWYVAVSVPIYQFLMLRWLVNLTLWAWLLRQVARLDLRLIPTHPDLFGGLGILAVAHVALAPLNFGLSAILVADYAELLRYANADVREVFIRVGLAAGASTLALVGPLLLFMPRLIAARQRGLLEYGDLACHYTRAFDTKWLRGGNSSGESLLGTADLQSLADLGNSYGVIQRMRVVPISNAQLLSLAAAAVVPILPLIHYVMPFDQLLIRGARTLLHL
jgi:hypothetical protein